MPLCSGVSRTDVIANSRKIIIPQSTALDPYFPNVQLLLHMEGANDANVFTDSSTAARSVTVRGNAKTKTDQYKFGASSLYLPGDTSGLEMIGGVSVGTSTDCTLECWVRPENLGGGPGGTIFGDVVVQILRISFDDLYSFWQQEIESTNNCIVDNQWQHVAITRSSGTIRLFASGVKVAEGTGNSAEFAARYIGYGAGAPWFRGWMDEIRWTIGVARYTANFTPPTEPFPDA